MEYRLNPVEEKEMEAEPDEDKEKDPADAEEPSSDCGSDSEEDSNTEDPSNVFSEEEEGKWKSFELDGSEDEPMEEEDESE